MNHELDGYDHDHQDHAYFAAISRSGRIVAVGACRIRPAFLRHGTRLGADEVHELPSDRARPEKPAGSCRLSVLSGDRRQAACHCRYATKTPVDYAYERDDPIK